MEAWLTRMYDRHGRRYLFGLVGCGATVLLATSAVQLLFAAHYQRLTPTEYGITCLAASASITISFAIGLAVYRRRLIPQFAWAAGDRTPELTGTAEDWAYRAPRRSLVLVFALGLVVATPAIVAALILQSSHQTTADVVANAIGVVATIAAYGAGAYGWFEIGLRPVRSSLRRYDLPASRSPGLAAHLLVPPLVTIFLASGGVGYLATDRSSGDTGLLLVWAIGAGITLITALVIVLAAYGFVINPVRSLARGHRSVIGGELPRIPVTASDELGELASTFNEMVDGLREREALRDRNAELVDQLRASQARIVASGDHARRQVEQDLHAGAQQTLAMLGGQLRQARQIAEGDPAAASEILTEANASLEQALAELRQLARGIYPQVLTSSGLRAALADAAEAMPISAVVKADGAERYPPEVEFAVYSCCVEALRNASQDPGDGIEASVTLSGENGVLEFEVADSGAGLEDASQNGSAGLQNMADRISALGGELRIESSPGHGTRVSGSVPVGD